MGIKDARYKINEKPASDTNKTRYETLRYEVWKWEFLWWTLVSLGQIYTLSPSRIPTAPMAPGRAAPFPA